MPQVVILGSVTIDEQVLDGAPAGCQVGGVPTYAGAALHAEGIEALGVTFLEAEREEQIRSILTELGVSLRYRSTPQGTRFRNTVSTAGARIQELLAVSPPLGSDLVAPALQEAACVYLGPVHPSEFALDVLQLLEAWPGIVALDVQGLTRSSTIGRVTAAVHPSMDRFLARAQFVKAGESEIAGLERHYGSPREALVNRFRIDELVVTDVERGGAVLLRDGVSVRYSAAVARTVGDPTGAGDVFFAVYLAARLSKREAPADACRLAARRAGEQVAGRFIQSARISL